MTTKRTIKPEPSPVAGSWRFIASDGDFDYSRPCFSPCGTQVLYMRSPKKQAHWSFWTVPAAGGDERVFFADPGFQATRPDWGWKRNEIAFTGQVGNAFNLWCLDVDGGRLREVETGDPATNNLEYPTWYPDGGSVAITDYTKLQLLRVDVETGAQTPLTDPSVVLTGMSSASPGTGNPLAFAGQPAGQPYNQEKNRIYVKLGDEPAFPLDGEQGRAPWWSPDGRWIAFESNRFGGGYTLLIERGIRLSADPPPPPIRPLPEGVAAVHPKWSPDGSLLVFGAAHDGTAGIAVVEVPPLP
jgi:Tol biopolymer transport system component